MFLYFRHEIKCFLFYLVHSIVYWNKVQYGQTEYNMASIVLFSTNQVSDKLYVSDKFM